MRAKPSQHTFSGATAESVVMPTENSVAIKPTHVLIGVETAGIIFTQDGSTPSSTNGQAMAAGEKLYLTDDIDRIKVIRQASGAVVNFTWYIS